MHGPPEWRTFAGAGAPFRLWARDSRWIPAVNVMRVRVSTMVASGWLFSAQPAASSTDNPRIATLSSLQPANDQAAATRGSAMAVSTRSRWVTISTTKSPSTAAAQAPATTNPRGELADALGRRRAANRVRRPVPDMLAVPEDLGVTTIVVGRSLPTYRRYTRQTAAMCPHLRGSTIASGRRMSSTKTSVTRQLEWSRSQFVLTRCGATLRTAMRALW